MKLLTLHTTQVRKKQQQEGFCIFRGRSANSNEHKQTLVSCVNIFIDVNLTNIKFSQQYFRPCAAVLQRFHELGKSLFLWFQVRVQVQFLYNANKYNFRDFLGWLSKTRALDTTLPVITCSKLVIETLEQGVEYVQS